MARWAWAAWWLAVATALWAQGRPYPDNLYDLAVVDSRLVAVGAHGVVLVSPDGGRSWRRVRTPTQNALVRVRFVGRRGWAVGATGTILHTEDAGESWALQRCPVKHYLFDVFFLDERRGWAVGEMGTVLHTEDGGGHWEVQCSGEDVILEGVWFLDERRGVATGEFGTVLITEDGGRSWTRVRGSARTLDIEAFGQLKPTLYSLAFRGKVGLAVGVDGCIVRTEDGGRTWQEVPSPTSNHLMRVMFADEKAYAVGLRGTLLVSKDLGRTWSLIPLPERFRAAWFCGLASTGPHLLLAGEEGRVLQLGAGMKWQEVR